MTEFLDLVRQVLDHQLTDADDLPCGKVDDVEIAIDGTTVRITALLVGPGAALERVPHPVRSWAKRIFGSHVTRIPWSTIGEIAAEIRLNSSAAELGLGKSERRLERLVRWIPGS